MLGTAFFLLRESGRIFAAVRPDMISLRCRRGKTALHEPSIAKPMSASQHRGDRRRNGHEARARSKAPEAPSTSAATDEEAEQYTVLRLNKTVAFRLSDCEKALIELLAEQADLSVGRYIVAACRAFGRAQLDDLRRSQQLDDIHEMLDSVRERGAQDFARAMKRLQKRRRKEPPIPKDLKIPFLQREHARPFERVVAEVARKMHASQFSVARLLSFFAESVGEEVRNGNVFRFPGFFIVGPWLPAEGTGPGGCLPRFQADLPFKTLVQWTCPEDAAQNRSLQAHRRRSRKKPSLLPQAMEAFRARIEAQDKAYLDSIEEWRAYGP